MCISITLNSSLSKLDNLNDKENHRWIFLLVFSCLTKKQCYFHTHKRIVTIETAFVYCKLSPSILTLSGMRGVLFQNKTNGCFNFSAIIKVESEILLHAASDPSSREKVNCPQTVLVIHASEMIPIP